MHPRQSLLMLTPEPLGQHPGLQDHTVEVLSFLSPDLIPDDSHEHSTQKARVNIIKMSV